MDFLPSIKTYLVDSGITTDIKFGRVPKEPGSVIVLRETGGPEPDANETAAMATPTMQVFVRAGTRTTAKTIVHDVHALLRQKTNLSVGGVYFYYVLAMQEPNHLGVDDVGRHEYSVNYRLKVRNA